MDILIIFISFGAYSRIVPISILFILIRKNAGVITIPESDKFMYGISLGTKTDPNDPTSMDELYFYRNSNLWETCRNISELVPV